MPNELDRESARTQTHCLTCGKRFEQAKFECPTCGEWSCSEACRERHIKEMDRV